MLLAPLAFFFKLRQYFVFCSSSGFIKAVWKNPVSSINGTYHCEITVQDKYYKKRILREETHVDMNEYNLNDAINSMREFKRVNEELRLLNYGQNMSIWVLKVREDTRVIFTAVNNAIVNVSDGANVVFPVDYINVGNGYDRNTGVFTCPVPGYYKFQVHILGARFSYAEVSIKVNGKRITSACVQRGYEFQSGSTAANVRLGKGDRVTVTAIKQTINLFNEDFCSFSGYLIWPFHGLKKWSH